MSFKESEEHSKEQGVNQSVLRRGTAPPCAAGRSLGLWSKEQ